MFMTLHHPALAPPPKPITAESLFNELFPALFELRKEFARALGGSIRFDIGQTHYHVDFDTLSVEKTSSKDADLILNLSEKELEGWLKGTVDVPSKVQSGAIRIAGNIEQLAKLGLLFSK